jgi:hypothetical protein
MNLFQLGGKYFSYRQEEFHQKGRKNGSKIMYKLGNVRNKMKFRNNGTIF